MFTAQKGKLFFNDPKFTEINKWNKDSQQAAVGKIFAGQRQLRRSQVASSTQQLRPSQISSEYVLLDFLQSRMNSFEDKLVLDVQELFMQKERIKDKYSEAEDLYQKSNRKLKKLISSVKSQNVSFNDIERLQRQVLEIQKLYEDNQFLKNMNTQIRSRIEEKQKQLGSNRK